MEGTAANSAALEVHSTFASIVSTYGGNIQVAGNVNRTAVDIDSAGSPHADAEIASYIHSGAGIDINPP